MLAGPTVVAMDLAVARQGSAEERTATEVTVASAAAAA